VLKKIAIYFNDFELIDYLKSENSSLKITELCKLLKVSKSSYYRSITTLQSEKKAQLIQEEEKIAEYVKEIKSKHVFWGYRKIRVTLKRNYNISIGLNRTYKIMKNMICL